MPNIFKHMHVMMPELNLDFALRPLVDITNCRPCFAYIESLDLNIYGMIVGSSVVYMGTVSVTRHVLNLRLCNNKFPINGAKLYTCDMLSNYEAYCKCKLYTPITMSNRGEVLYNSTRVTMQFVDALYQVSRVLKLSTTLHIPNELIREVQSYLV